MATPPLIDKIATLADEHPARLIVWPRYGRVPRGYTQGVAVTYARWYLKLLADDPTAKAMARPAAGNRDALVYYAKEFADAGIDIHSDGLHALRARWTMLFGLGVPESSGNWSCGRDQSADNTSALTCEASAWQTSYNSLVANRTVLNQLFTLYQKFPDSGFLYLFEIGAPAPRQSDLRNYGTGPGVEFQKLSKDCPAFAAAWAVIVMQSLYTHYGTIIRRLVRIDSRVYDLLEKVEALVDTDRAAYAAALSEDPATPILVPVKAKPMTAPAPAPPVPAAADPALIGTAMNIVDAVAPFLSKIPGLQWMAAFPIANGMIRAGYTAYHSGAPVTSLAPQVITDAEAGFAAIEAAVAKAKAAATAK